MLNPPQDDEPRSSGSRRTVAVAVLAVVVVAAVAVVAVVVIGRGSSSTAAAPGSTVATPTTTSAAPASTTTAATTTPAAAVAGTCSYPASGTAARPAVAPPATAPTTGTFTGQLTTSAGPVPFTLDRAKAPCTVASVVSLASQSFYDHAPCSRLTTASIFVLQCGDPTGTGTGGPGYTVPDELPAATGTTAYPRGTIAMANTGAPNTGGSQFFLVYKDSPLPPTYTVFGTVSPAGLATLDAIAAKGTANGTGDGPPATPVTILALSGS